MDSPESPVKIGNETLNIIRSKYPILLSTEAISQNITPEYLIGAYNLDPIGFRNLRQLEDIVLRNIELKRIQKSGIDTTPYMNMSLSELINIGKESSGAYNLLTLLPSEIMGSVLSYIEPSENPLKQSGRTYAAVSMAGESSFAYWKGKTELILGVHLGDDMSKDWISTYEKVKLSSQYVDYYEIGLKELGIPVEFRTDDTGRELRKIDEYSVEQIENIQMWIKSNIPVQDRVFLGACAMNYDDVMILISMVFTIDINMYDNLSIRLACKNKPRSFKILYNNPSTNLNVKDDILYTSIMNSIDNIIIPNMILDNLKDNRYKLGPYSYLTAASKNGNYKLFKRLWKMEQLSRNIVLTRTLVGVMDITRPIEYTKIMMKEKERSKILKLILTDKNIYNNLTGNDYQVNLYLYTINGHYNLLEVMEEMQNINARRSIDPSKVFQHVTRNINTSNDDVFKALPLDHPLIAGRMKIIHKYMKLVVFDTVVDEYFGSKISGMKFVTESLREYILKTINNFPSPDPRLIEIRRRILLEK